MVNKKKTIISRKFMYCLALLLSLTLVALIAGCDSKRTYKKEIEQKGITYSRKSFLNRIEEGNKEIIELFIKAGIDVNAKDERGASALILASYAGNLELAKLLIEEGADVNAKDEEGVTALMWASANGDYELVELLIKKGADVNAENNRGSTALGWASAAGKASIEGLLRSAGARK